MKPQLILLTSLLLSINVGMQPTADLVLLNGKIWTVNRTQPEAEAVACLGNRIIAVGSNQEIRKWIGSNTRVIDLQGKRAVPGFNDAHVHFFAGGAGLSSVQLRDARTPEEFRNRIRDYAAKLPKGRWILNGNWDHENWSPARLPTRRLIDDVTQNNPVFINRLDGHMALANSLALKLAGVTRETADPPGGTIVRESKGEPEGVLKDAAMNFVSQVIPNPGDDEIADAIRAAMRYAAENGVTSAQDMSSSAERNGRRDRRLRIKHAQHLRAEEIKRFGIQHVIVSMQPYHAIDDGRDNWL